ncbi:hypothetical protein ACFSTI_11625 [Rhizorhabdus histidinilytica]
MAEHAHRFDFYSYCEQYAQQRAQLAATFRGVMKRYGSKRPKFGSVLGSAHRFYLDIRGPWIPGSSRCSKSSCVAKPSSHRARMPCSTMMDCPRRYMRSSG